MQQLQRSQSFLPYLFDGLPALICVCSLSVQVTLVYVQEKIREQISFLDLIQEFKHVLVLCQAWVELLIFLIFISCFIAILVQISENILRIV